MSLFNYFKKVPKSNSSTQNSSAIATRHTSETESEVLESANPNREILISTSNSQDLDCTVAKTVSTFADSCSACSSTASACAYEKQSVTDLGDKINGPKQPILETYPSTLIGDHERKFNTKWFQMFPFLEYSISKDRVFCFPCREFSSGLGYSENVFTKSGYCDWKNIKRKLILHRN